MSPGSNRLAILQADRSRTSPMCGATFPREHVARDRPEVRHPSPCMSLGIVAQCDIRAFACRSGSSRSATFEPLHVARRAREGRQGGARMSPDPRVPCDMCRRPCRFTRSPRATWGTMHVARPERASVDPWPCGATCSTVHVASCDCGVRHGRAGMPMHQRGSGDIPSWEATNPGSTNPGSAFSKTRRSAKIARGPYARVLVGGDV
jgi:hypothetical protein